MGGAGTLNAATIQSVCCQSLYGSGWQRSLF